MKFLKRLLYVAKMLWFGCFIGSFFSSTLSQHTLRAVSAPMGIWLLLLALESCLTKQVHISGVCLVSAKARLICIVAYCLLGALLLLWGGSFLLEALYA